MSEVRVGISEADAREADEAKLRTMTIGELVDAFEGPQDYDDQPLLVERALQLILAYAIEFYDRCDRPSKLDYSYPALCLAREAVTANDPEDLDAEHVHWMIAAVACTVLEAQPSMDVKWDAATVAALKTIRNTNEDFADGEAA